MCVAVRRFPQVCHACVLPSVTMVGIQTAAAAAYQTQYGYLKIWWLPGLQQCMSFVLLLPSSLSIATWGGGGEGGKRKPQADC